MTNDPDIQRDAPATQVDCSLCICWILNADGAGRNPYGVRDFEREREKCHRVWERYEIIMAKALWTYWRSCCRGDTFYLTPPFFLKFKYISIYLPWHNCQVYTQNGNLTMPDEMKPFWKFKFCFLQDFHWLDASDTRTSSERRPRGKNPALHSPVYRWVQSFIN